MLKLPFYLGSSPLSDALFANRALTKVELWITNSMATSLWPWQWETSFVSLSYLKDLWWCGYWFSSEAAIMFLTAHPPFSPPWKLLCGPRDQLSILSVNYSIWEAITFVWSTLHSASILASLLSFSVSSLWLIARHPYLKFCYFLISNVPTKWIPSLTVPSHISQGTIFPVSSSFIIYNLSHWSFPSSPPTLMFRPSVLPSCWVS